MKNFVDLSVDEKTKKEILAAISKIIDQSSYILGDSLDKFEKAFAKFNGSKYAVGVGSGTDAIRLALKALGIGRGDKVLTVSFTSPFTAIAICQEGAIPVFCDIDQNSWTIDLRDMQTKADSKTKAIVPVHIYGNPCNMTALLAFAKSHGLKIVEDACQAHGAEYKGKKIGNFSDASAFSFYPTKNLGAFGDGGCVVTNNMGVNKMLRVLRHGGQTKRFWHEFLGVNSRLDEIQAAVLLRKLVNLNDDNKRRTSLAKRYKSALGGLPIKFQTAVEGGKSSNHLFCVRVERRNELKTYLDKCGIPCDIHYPNPVHKQKAFQQFINHKLPVTEKITKEIISLPLYPTLTLGDQDKIISAVKKFYR